MMKKKTSLAILVSIAFAGLIATGGTLAWFNSQAFLQNMENPIEGSVQDKYYASGSGAYNDPFVINQPRHLYNLAWLQYLGFYNKNDGGIDDHQFYFVLGDNVDMSSFGPIPPIGTEQNPFIGHFDGQGYVVSNVTITNEFSEYTSHPSVMDEGWDDEDDELNHQQPHILGFFGVVGYPGGNKNTSYDTLVNEFVNTGLTGVTVKTETLNTLMGVAAGLVYDADLTDTHNVLNNVIIDDSTISLVESGETASYGGRTTNISDYTIVGFTNNKTGVARVSETMYGVNIDSNITFSASEDGNVNGWGGSINMINLYDRVTDIRKSTTYSADNNNSYAWKKNHVIAPGGEKNTSADNISTADSDVDTSDGSIRVFKHGTNTYTHAGNYVNFHRGDSSNYNYLMGGTYNVYNYQKYYRHTGYRITVDGEHYLTATSFANNGAVTSSSENNAIVWTIPTTGTTGKIYTTYNYTDYYLTVNGNTVNLRTGSANGTTWEIDRDASGHVRYVYNGYYLNYDNGWVMTALPEEPEEPEEPQAPAVVSQPNQATYNARKISMPANADSTYQISYTYNDVTYYLNATSNSVSTSQNIFTTGWQFSNLSGNSTTIRIYNTSNYLRNSGNNSLGMGNSLDWNVSSSGNNTYKFSQSSWFTTRYIRFNGSSFTYGTTDSQDTLTVLTTETVVNNYNAAIDAEYAAALQEYNDYLDEYSQYEDDHDDWVTEHAEWVTDHANWVTTMTNLHPITVSSATVDGPDIDNTYDRTEYGMEYTSTNTTFFPLNVVKDDEATHTSTTADITTYYPKETNTGYMTIGSNYTNSTTQASRLESSMRVSRYNAASGTNNKNIKNSFKTGDSSLTNVKTINTSGNIVTIDNSMASSYEKYTDSKAALEAILTSDAALESDTRYLYGLHFMDATISMEHILTADWVSIGGQEKTNYDLPVNSIDFNLKESGFINFFAGTYFTDTVDSFFSLHKIVRSGNTISNIFEIEEIYKDTSTTAQNHAYVYKLKDMSGNYTYSCPFTFDAAGNKTSLVAGKNPDDNNLALSDLPSGYKSASSLLFKTSQIKINNLSSYQYYAYYFEIPVNAGEYCLGSVPGGTGGYLLYLDIGANAAKTNRTVFYEKFVVTEKSYNYPSGVALMELPSSFTSLEPTIDIEEVIDDSDSACMVIKESALGDFSIERTGNQAALTRAQEANAPPVYAGNDITKVYDTADENEANIEPTPVSTSSYDIKRMEFYDYIINSDTLIRTIITDKSNGSGGYTRTIVQSLYNGTTVSGNPTATYIYDGTTDQRNSMKVSIQYFISKLIQI